MDSAPPPGLVALAGAPNVGKTTLFNQLTRSNQRVGNYSGVTVEKVSGVLRGSQPEVRILDLPGTYNLFPRSEDEEVVFRVLCGLLPDTTADAIAVVANSTQLERGLFLTTQLIDMGYPAMLILNKDDQARKGGIGVNKNLLERLLGIPVFLTSAHRGEGMEELRSAIEGGRFKRGRKTVDPYQLCDQNLLVKVSGLTAQPNPYRALQLLKFHQQARELKPEVQHRLSEMAAEYKFDARASQRKETKLRYERVHELLAKCLRTERKTAFDSTLLIDKVVLHPWYGFALFLGLLFVIFQAIFSWAQGPMDAIDRLFAWMSASLSTLLPAGAINDLLCDAIIPGLGGIVIFIPQIALLFAFLAILEGSGYMARAVFITDKVMRPVGLNGRSVVPLISGFACAIPAIMATRSIGHKRDRLITIFVTPFMSCSARLPVYIVLIGLLFPTQEGTFLNMKGAALFLMYILGIAAAMCSALLLKLLMNKSPGGGLVLELPRYQWPNWRIVGKTMYSKSMDFVMEAGKIILAISVVLWVLASYGPENAMQRAEEKARLETPAHASEGTYEAKLAAYRLQASYAGQIGSWIEPVIRPLGYDWKIGIALVCSFAAREVFVSTMATLYSLGDVDEEFSTLQKQMKDERRADGSRIFTPATIWSLLIFYAFAMQCMSTIAVVYRETGSLKWPLLQTLYMTALAYLSALAVYQLLA